ncbi:hypothetical protein B0O80DRAFT_469558 [Mortierella sp. GBAus27b]|nr:hypothetical protein BGX31_001508 [Mortierella sp. GBA43]KAI8346272.1 hypothetical protein B0O80DRAFT_469558 [Mortierella sp. GBAus27b]
MSTIPGSWANLFPGHSSTTAPSSLYTEEAVQNHKLTTDQVIDRAQSSASLLFEMVVSMNVETETTLSFEDNDIIQTLRHECQEMAEYLTERIWEESENQASYNIYASSSSSYASRSHPKNDAEIAAFISCQEQIQSALKRYEEVRDYLKAKDLQDEEVQDNHAYRSSHPYEHEEDLESVAAIVAASLNAGHGHIDSSSTYAAAAAALDDEDDLYSYNDYDYGSHLRRSEQPLVWQLDPREDFKAGQKKMKKGISSEERRRLDLERQQEKYQTGSRITALDTADEALEMQILSGNANESNQLTVKEESSVQDVQESKTENVVENKVENVQENKVESVQENKVETVQEDDEEEEEALTRNRSSATSSEETTPIVESRKDEQKDINKLLEQIDLGQEAFFSNNTQDIEKQAAHKEHQAPDNEEDAFSDDSWEAVPDQGAGVYGGDLAASASSSTSSFLVASADGSSRVLTPPS